MWPLGVALTQSSTPFPAPHQVSISLPTPLNYATAFLDRKSTRLNSSHSGQSRMPSSA